MEKAKTVTLELPENTYELLLKKSIQVGRTPEQIILEWVESQIQETLQDPLLQLAGTFESDITDVSERHDEYIGQALRDNDDRGYQF